MLKTPRETFEFIMNQLQLTPGIYNHDCLYEMMEDNIVSAYQNIKSLPVESLFFHEINETELFIHPWSDWHGYDVSTHVRPARARSDEERVILMNAYDDYSEHINNFVNKVFHFLTRLIVPTSLCENRCFYGPNVDIHRWLPAATVWCIRLDDIKEFAGKHTKNVTMVHYWDWINNDYVELNPYVHLFDFTKNT